MECYPGVCMCHLLRIRQFIASCPEYWLESIGVAHSGHSDCRAAFLALPFLYPPEQGTACQFRKHLKARIITYFSSQPSHRKSKKSVGVTI